MVLAAYSSTYRAKFAPCGWIRESRDTPEEAVVRLWRNADNLAAGLVTRDGARLKVLYPGRRSNTAGPDFRDCILSNELGELIVGDVEVHVTVGGWSAHRHYVDPNYNGVVLHVVLKPKGTHTTTLESRVEIPVATLEHVAKVLEKDERPSLPEGQETSRADIHMKLDSAGDARFLSKASGLALEIEAQDPEQVLYAGIMEALGYSANQKPFAALAKNLPIAQLRAMRDEPPGTRLLAIRAMLISAAGLSSSASIQDAQQFRDVLRHLPSVKKITAPWKVFRVRPSNQPIRRVEGAALIVDRSMDGGLLTGLKESARRGDHLALTRSLEAAPFIGSSRARDIVVNVALPFMYALGGIKRDEKLRTESLEAFRKAPGLADNEITREMKTLLPKGIDTRGARRQLRLHHLYKNMRGLWSEEQKTKPKNVKRET